MIVSLLGWIMVIRGILLIAFPDLFMYIADRTIGTEGIWRTGFAVLVLVGLYLTYAGWVARPEPTASPVVSPGSDLPRAA